MENLSVGKWIRIQSYKHDGSLHRTWDNMMLVDVNDDFIATGSIAARVVESDGRIWYTKEPAVSIFFLKKWFNIIAMIRGTNIVYYCNIASPSLEDNNIIKYIDYDLDLKLFPDQTILELDKREYLYHKDLYNYSDELDKVINHEFARVRKLMENHEFPFNDEKMREYIKTYYSIKNEQDPLSNHNRYQNNK